VRLLATWVLWLITTAALAVAVPTVWAQHTVIGGDGYAALAQRAAADPKLQSAVAAQLGTYATALIVAHGSGVAPSRVREVATAYTASPGFPAQFAQTNRLAHHWVFSDTTSQAGQHRWVVDLSPMLNDPAFQQLLSRYHVQAPATMTVPVTATPPHGLRPGRLQPLATWGPWAGLGVSALTGLCAVLTLAAARGRGKALASLGVSALLAGAAGWAGIEAGHRFLGEALDYTTGSIRQIAELMVAHAENSLHQWLNLTLAAGGVLVVLGVSVALLGGLRKPG
jgi:hypothetical protein